jgi:PiT family inorganic phosphate transporter
LILVVQTLQQADGALKKMQLLSPAAFSLGHSGNDSLKK